MEKKNPGFLECTLSMKFKLLKVYHRKIREKKGRPWPLQWEFSLSKCLTFHGGQILLITWLPDTLQSKSSAGPLCAYMRLPLCFNWSHGQHLKLVIMCASHPYYNKEGAYNVCLPTKKKRFYLPNIPSISHPT